MGMDVELAGRLEALEGFVAMLLRDGMTPEQLTAYRTAGLVALQKRAEAGLSGAVMDALLSTQLRILADALDGPARGQHQV